MRTRYRAIVLMAVAAVFASVLALPASADTSGAAVIQGFATVGKWFAEDCDKSGRATVTGRGLYLPGTQPVPNVSNGAANREEDGVWHFKTAGTAVTTGGPQTFALEVCGWLGPVVDADSNRETTAGLGGASCGNSKGHHGQGEVVLGGVKLKVYDVGWKSSAGGVLPVNGRYQEYVGATNVKEEKYGLVTGVVTARGGDDCLGLKQPLTNNGNGAQSFDVIGVIDLVNTGAIEPADPKTQLPDTTDDKDCKGSGGEAPIGADGKKRHDEPFKPDDEPCEGGDK